MSKKGRNFKSLLQPQLADRIFLLSFHCNSLY